MDKHLLLAMEWLGGTGESWGLRLRPPVPIQIPRVCKDSFCSNSTLKSCPDKKDGEVLRLQEVSLYDVPMCILI